MERSVKCPNCKTKNPDGAKFCYNCGNKLIRVCPNCSTENPLQASFCFNCRHSLAKSQIPTNVHASGARQAGPQPALLNRFLPQELVDK